MATKSKSMAKGLVLAVSFFVVLFLMFMPIYNGHNAFVSADNLFNTMSKGSTMGYIPNQLEEAQKHLGETYDLELVFKDGKVEGHEGYHAVGSEVAANAGRVLSGPASAVTVSGNTVQVSMDLGRVLQAALQDAQAMFEGNSQAIGSRHDMDPKLAMFTWWKVLAEMHRKLLLSNEAAAAKTVDRALKRGVELAYNFEGIPAVKASDNIGMLAGSLIFYVVYTMWWGLAILYIFEGLGLAMTKGKKAEV